MIKQFKKIFNKVNKNLGKAQKAFVLGSTAVMLLGSSLNLDPVQVFTFEYREVDHVQTANLIKLIREVKGNDIIQINVKNPGGYLSDLLELMDVIENDDTHIKVRVNGMAASAAAIFTMSTKDRSIGSNAQMVFHVARYSTFTGVQLIDFNDPYHMSFTKIASKYISQYLTDDELHRYLSGEDVYILGEDMNKRGIVNTKGRLLELLNTHFDLYNKIIHLKNGGSNDTDEK